MANTFTGMGSKVVSIIKKVAPIAGAGKAWLSAPFADDRDMKGAMEYVWTGLQNGILKGKIANPLITTQHALSLPNEFPIAEGALSWLTGLGLEMAGDAIENGMIKSMGGALRGFGSSEFWNTLASAWVYLARYNPHDGGAEYSFPDVTRQGTQPTKDTVWRTRASAHIRGSVGQATAVPL